MKRWYTILTIFIIFFSGIQFAGCESKAKEPEITPYEIEQERIKKELEIIATKSNAAIFTDENYKYTIDLQDDYLGRNLVLYSSISDIYRKENTIILVINTYNVRFELDCTNIYQEMRNYVDGQEYGWEEYAFLISVDSIRSTSLELEYDVDAYDEDDYEVNFELESMPMIIGKCISISKID